MSTATTPGGLPYPQPDEPLANMDLAIKALATAVDPHGAVLQRNALQALPTSVWTPITFDTEAHDPFGEVAANPSAFVVPSSGLWLFCATVTFATNVTGQRGARLQVGASNTLGFAFNPAPTATPFVAAINVTAIAKLSTGDAVQLQGYHNAGGAAGGAALNAAPAGAPCVLGAARLAPSS